jgi:hypothetical protein
MSKKLGAVLVIVLLLFVASFAVARADPPPPVPTPHGKPTTPPGLSPAKEAEKGAKRHGVFGTVTSKGSDSFVVHTKQNDDYTVTVSGSTKFHIPTNPKATFADLHRGDRVAVNGTPTDGGLAAKNVAVAPGKPSIQHRVGMVTLYTANVSITIRDIKDETKTYMFALTNETEIRNPKGSGVKIGDRVTVVSRRDPSTDTFTATAIVVHPK